MGESELFANQRQANLRSSVALIEKVLSELGHCTVAVNDVELNVLSAWHVNHGSAAITIALLDKQPFPHLRVCATIMTLDDMTVDQNQATAQADSLREFLLAENVGLMGSAFAMIDKQVLLLSQRSTLDLDHSEIMDITKNIMHTADHYDDLLVSKYGGRHGGKAL